MQTLGQALYNIQEAVIIPKCNEVWEQQIKNIMVGTTRIYGQCVGVVGERRPHAEIRLAEGTRIRAYTTREKAIELGRMLYENVSLDGEATWQLPNWTIIKFQISDIYKTVNVPPDKAFEMLKRSLGKYWQDVDAEQYVEAERYGRGAG